MEEQKRALDEQKRALDEQKRALDEQKRALDEQKRALDEQKRAFEAEKRSVKQCEFDLFQEKLDMDPNIPRMREEDMKQFHAAFQALDKACLQAINGWKRNEETMMQVYDEYMRREKEGEQKKGSDDSSSRGNNQASRSEQ